MYDPLTYPKYDAVKKSLLKVHRILRHIQRNFGLYSYLARYLSINEKTIGFQVRHKYKLWITFKDSGNVFQADGVCYHGYT